MKKITAFTATKKNPQILKNLILKGTDSGWLIKEDNTRITVSLDDTTKEVMSGQ